MRETDTGLLEYGAIREDTTAATTTDVAFPVITSKYLFAVCIFERLHNTLLEGTEVFADFPN